MSGVRVSYSGYEFDLDLKGIFEYLSLPHDQRNIGVGRLDGGWGPPCDSGIPIPPYLDRFFQGMSDDEIVSAVHNMNGTTIADTYLPRGFRQERTRNR